mgnify:FL=1
MRKRAEINNTHLYLDLIISYRYIDRALRDFLIFVYRDIKSDKYLTEFLPILCLDSQLILFTLKNKNVVYLSIKKDDTFLSINTCDYKNNIFAIKTKDFFQNEDTYKSIFKQIKKYIRVKNEKNTNAI